MKKKPLVINLIGGPVVKKKNDEKDKKSSQYE